MTGRGDGQASDDLRRHILFKRDGERSLAPNLADHMLDALNTGAAPDYQALLHAAQWPDPPLFVFHTAPRAARHDIELGGLRVSQPGSDDTDSPWADPDGVWAGQRPGVYVTDEPDVRGRWSRWPQWDVWRVNIVGLSLRPDVLNPRCWVLDGPVSPDRVRFESTHALSD